MIPCRSSVRRSACCSRRGRWAVIGRLAETRWDQRLLTSVAAMLVGNAAIYAIGLPWLALATGYSLDETIAKKDLLPFLAGDIVKLVLAGVSLPAAWWIVRWRS